MSDGHAPRNSPSGEFRAYIKDKAALTVSLLTIAAILISLVLYVGSKASTSDVDAAIARAIAIHRSENAHHGVAGMIQTYAMPKSEGIRMGVKLEAFEESRRRLSNRLDRIEGKIDDLLADRKRQRKHR